MPDVRHGEFGNRGFGDPGRVLNLGKREIARGIILPAGLPKQASQAFRERSVNWILAPELFGRGAEKSQTGNQFQGIGPSAHEIFDADPSDKLFANRSDDFFIARTQDWITQVSA